MRALGRALAAEALKLRRTLALWMTLVAPLIVVLFQFLNFLDRGQYMVKSGTDAWAMYAQGSFAIWALFMLPLLIALEAALLGALEHGTSSWKHLFALPAPRWTVLLAKQIVALLAVLTGTMLLVAGIACSGIALHALKPQLGFGGIPDLAGLLRTGLTIYLAAWLILAIQSWVALRWASTALPLGVGVAGTFFALFAAGSERLRFYPWALPIRSIGEQAPRAALILGLGGGVVAMAVGTWALARRDAA